MLAQSSWREVAAAYRAPVMRTVLVNGIVSGFPWTIFGSLLSLWLQSAGYSRSQIGIFALLTLPYALNLLWAPLVDTGALFKRFALGARHSWIIAMQCILLLCLLLTASLDIGNHITLLAVVMLIVAFAGATQDVAIDAWRIEQTSSIAPAFTAAGAAVSTIGWWTGYGLGGALSIGSLQWLEIHFPQRSWQMSYLLLAVLVVLCIVALLYTRRIVPEVHKPQPKRTTSTAKHAHTDTKPWPAFISNLRALCQLYIHPVRSFVRNYGFKLGSTLLAAIFLFKLGEAFLGKMSIVFYGEYFSKNDIALYSKTFGALSYCLFAFVGSLLSVRFGLLRGMVIGGILMAATNLLFALLPHYPNTALFAFTVAADQMTTGISSVAFVAFISQLCDRFHTATHYAALASLGNLARTTLASSSGLVVDGLGGNWSLFFIITSLMVLPSLLLLLWMRTPITTALTRRTHT